MDSKAQARLSYPPTATSNRYPVLGQDKISIQSQAEVCVAV